jgi:tRNA nucleotidyltransferase (CCA-adding enzyme)
MNIASCFGKLIMRIQPLEPELSLARQHVYVIRNRLTATFKINRFVPGGSLSRETYIRGQSDVDLFAVISRSDVMWGNDWVSSTTTLNNNRDELASRYPKTPVGKDVHAVVVEFSEGQSVDVVPVVFDKMLDGKWSQYWIPDGDGSTHTATQHECKSRGIGKGSFKQFENERR